MPTRKKPAKRLQRTASIIDAAGELDLSEDTVRRDLRRGCPHSREGNAYRLNVPEYKAWRESKGLTGERGRPSETPDSPDLEKARLRKENALASKYELQVKRERAELIPVVEVKQFCVQMLGTFRNKVRGIPASASPRLEGRDGAEREVILASFLDESLNDLADSIRELCRGASPAEAD